MKYELRAFSRPWSNDVAFIVAATDFDGKRSIGRSVTMEAQKEEGIFAPDPTFRLGMDQAQELIDELYRIGFRPTQGKQSEGVTAAQAQHLEDMRAITFAKLNIPAPQPLDRRR